MAEQKCLWSCLGATIPGNWIKRDWTPFILEQAERLERIETHLKTISECLSEMKTEISKNDALNNAGVDIP